MLTALLLIQQQRSELAETPEMTSPMSPMMEEWIPKAVAGGQLVLAVE